MRNLNTCLGRLTSASASATAPRLEKASPTGAPRLCRSDTRFLGGFFFFLVGVPGLAD